MILATWLLQQISSGMTAMNELLALFLSLLGVKRKYIRIFMPSSRNIPVPKATRDAVRFVYGNKCLKCLSTENIQIDHIVPRSWGGSNDFNNLQPLCARCNQAKSNNNAVDYRRN